MLIPCLQDLLQSLVDSGKIKARTKWKDVYPRFRDDERYLNMLGNPGSNPLELFWDAVDALDQTLDQKITVVEETFTRYNAEKDASDDKAVERQDEAREVHNAVRFSITPETTAEEFLSVVKAAANDATKALSEQDLRDVYKTVSISDRYLISSS